MQIKRKSYDPVEQSDIKFEDDINVEKKLVINNHQYKLCGFVNHITRGNHYTAHILHGDDSWYEYNDESVKPKS